MSTILNALKKAGQEERGQPPAERPPMAERSQLLDSGVVAEEQRGPAPLEALRESQKRAITRIVAGISVGGIIVLSVLLFLIVWFWSEARNARSGLRSGPTVASITAPRGQTREEAPAVANKPATEGDLGAKPVARPTRSRLISGELAATAPLADAPLADAPQADAPLADAPQADAPQADTAQAAAPPSDDSAEKRGYGAKKAKAKSREKTVAVAQASPQPALPPAPKERSAASSKKPVAASKRPVELNNESLLDLAPAASDSAGKAGAPDVPPAPEQPAPATTAPAPPTQAAAPEPAPPSLPSPPAPVPANPASDEDASRFSVLKIGGILWSRTNPLAIVNDKMCEVGSAVGDFKVTMISKTSVEVESKSGERRVINY